MTTEAPKTKRTWQEARTIRLLQTSPSQHETWNRCKRLWWLKHVRRLPEIQRGSTIFGTVLHSVIERYLGADALGRAPDGTPVELYPEGWTVARNRYKPQQIDGEVTPAESEIIRRLVAEAIENGILERFDERAIEQEITLPVAKLPCHACNGKWVWKKGEACDVCGCAFGTDHDADKHQKAAGQLVEAGDLVMARLVLDPPPWVCPACDGDGKGDTIQVKMFVDYLTPDSVQDHKSCKVAKYALSRNALRENIQLLMNAKGLLALYAADGREPPEKISLRHNQFIKDPDDLRVRKTEVFVIPSQVESAWQDRVAEAMEMSRLRREANNWQQCPDPVSRVSACNAYGGCPFIPICAGKETEEMYEKRIDRQIEMSKMSGIDVSVTEVMDTISTPINEEPKMGIMDRLKQNINLNNGNAQAVAGAINPPALPVTTVTAPAQALAPVAAPVLNVAPAAPAPVAGIDPKTAAAIAAIDCAEGARAPWANPTCKSCSGFGWATSGRPCRICDNRAAQAGSGKLTSENFTITVMGDGNAGWQLKADPSVEGISQMHAANEVKAEVRVEAPAPAPAAAPAPVVVSTPDTPTVTITKTVTAPVTAPTRPPVPPEGGTTPEAEDDETTTKGKRGRPARSFTLVLNAVVTKGVERPGSGRHVHHLSDVYADLQKNLAAAYVADKRLPEGSTFHDMDAFRRRDEMAKNAAEVAKSFAGDFVACDLSNATPDLKAFVEALRPLAGCVIVGTH